VPHYIADVDVEARLRERLTISPAIRRVIVDYLASSPH
jgi:hypothetical protein